jgi:hypothetical protein
MYDRFAELAVPLTVHRPAEEKRMASLRSIIESANGATSNFAAAGNMTSKVDPMVT